MPRFGARVVDADLEHREAALQLESAAHRAFAGAEFGFEKPVYLNGETTLRELDRSARHRASVVVSCGS
jgi:hypothetical protein